MKSAPAIIATWLARATFVSVASSPVARMTWRGFGAIAVLSPSIWWDRRAVLARVEALEGPLPWRIWLDVGTAEGRDTLRNARALKALLLDKGWSADRLHYVEVKDAPHSEGAWAERVEGLLEFLFPPPP